jgi:hypothetical protein
LKLDKLKLIDFGTDILGISAEIDLKTLQLDIEVSMVITIKSLEYTLSCIDGKISYKVQKMENLTIFATYPNT